MIKEKMLEYLCLHTTLTRKALAVNPKETRLGLREFKKVDMTEEQRTVLLNRYLSLEDELVNQYRLPSDVLKLTSPK